VADLEWLRDRFEAWLRAQGSDAPVGRLAMPGSGMSNDTFLLDGMVLRLAPEGRGLFPEYDLEAQVTLLRALGARPEAGIPVPEVLWWEPDPDALGRPFYVMARVHGRIPPDGHLFGGWLLESSPDDQARVLDEYLAVLARIHALDIRDGAFDVLDRAQHGASPLEQELGYWRAYLDWASDGDPLPTIEAFWDWCVEHRPTDDTVARGLVWGDARLGNLIVDDALAPVAVLDWEMAVLGPPELDLGWHLFLERTAQQFAPNLPGFPDHAGLVAAYERHAGRRLEHLHWYEAWGGFRTACIQVRMAPTPEARERNPVTKALRALM
jgi:aminoglycoside phosphotransferase (APT) family kinase protein